MSLPSGAVDPVTLEILSHRLYGITKEMGITLERTGGTVNTTQQHDYMAALYRPDGDILSAGETFGQHVACAGFAVKRIIERFGRDEIYPDDVFLLNDPYLAAIHQSDIYTISPIHYQDRLVGWSATFVHVSDVGAMSPGGDSPRATEVFQEGLRIPGLKLVERGSLRQDVFDTITNMTRQPGMVGLDLKCEIAANNVAKSRMQAMYRQYGPELVDAVSGEMIRCSESILRKRISEIPDGSWSEIGTIEAGDSWRIHMTLRKTGDRLVFDLTGSDRQATKGINLPYHATLGMCFAATLTSLAYDIPKNQGVLRPLEIIAPEGSIVNVQYPGPVSMSTTSSGFMVIYVASSVLMQMLATSIKWRKEIVAPTASHRNGKHSGLSQYGKYCVFNLAHGALDGSGARVDKDGVDSGGSYMSVPNVEWFEQNFPIMYLFRRHAMDAAGAGKFRGGVGAETAHMIHDSPEGGIKGVAYGVAGLRNSGHGIFGGYPGAPSVVALLEDTKVGDLVAQNKAAVDLAEIGGRRLLLPYCDFELKENSILFMRVASGGGYGDPLERDPELVRHDVMNRLVSQEVAQETYGVVLNGGGLDRGATRRLRDLLRKREHKST